MVWTSDLENNHSWLSDTDLSFRKIALADDHLLGRDLFDSLNDNKEVFCDPLQPWPTFVDSSRLKMFAESSVGISRLIRSIPERLFDYDPEKICNQFDLENVVFAELTLMEPNGLREGLARGDFVCTDSGFKCLEFNMTSSLGGWESGELAELQLQIPAIQQFITQLELDVDFTHTLRLLFCHVIRESVRSGLVDSEVNTVFGIREPIEAANAPSVLKLMEREYEAALSEVDRGLQGSVRFCEYGETTEKRGFLYCGGKRVHVAIELHAAPSAPNAFRAFKGETLNLYNGPISLIMSDKRNLALLSEMQESEVFSREERQLISSYIPWTRQVRSGRTCVEGDEVQLEDHVLNDKDRFVLKKARSFGGADVVIGRYSTKERWFEFLELAVVSGGWIVQEFVESRPFLYQDGAYGCSEHDVVWGPFVFGDTYAGATLKMQPKRLDGVVNLTRGATVGMIFEVADVASDRAQDHVGGPRVTAQRTSDQAAMAKELVTTTVPQLQDA